MSWGDVLAGVGGAANGADSSMRYYAGLDNKKQMAEMRDALQRIIEEDRNTRHEQDLTAREKALKAKTDAADADRKIRADDVAGRLQHLGEQDDLGWGRLDLDSSLGYQRDDTTRRGQDFTRGTTERGQNMTQATAFRGQDLTAGTAAAGQEVTQRGQDISAGVTQRGQNMSFTRPRSNSLMDLLNMSQGGAPAAPAPAPVPPATVAPPPRVGPAAVPVRPRGASNAPAAPSGLVKGAAVTLKNGKKVTVDSVNPDGSFTYH